jgi:hypothetical protein
MKTFASYLELKAALQALGSDEILAAVHLTPALAEDILAHDPVNRDLRKSNLAKIKREIEGNHWDPRKAPLMRFLTDSFRLADGQHRCRAVIETGKSIVQNMAVVPDTIGLDQGAVRSLADQLSIHEGLTDKHERDLAATVTKAICDIPGATDREQIAYYEEHKEFILECVRKPLQWLADKEVSVVAVMKPNLLAVTRAQEIVRYEQPAQEVDELLEDVVNGGDTAPEGSPRRAVARQIWDAMQQAHTKRGARLKDVIKWVRTGLDYKRKGTVKSVMLARFPGKSRGKKVKSNGRPAQRPLELVTS